MTNYWITVVDDDPICLTNARNLLNEQNMRVSCVRSGSDLLKFMKINTPDLILLDILMPDMDGFETYEQLREFEKDEDRKQTPVIFLTGENDTETERRGLSIGASDFIRKPFNKDVLLTRINNTITSVKTIENLTEEASIDRLTGFFNKASGTAKAEECCKSKNGALMILDLDSFKLVNDLYGHEMGDNVLKTFAELVRQNTNKQDLLCRIGGDEFMTFLYDTKEEETIKTMTRQLNEQLVEKCRQLMGEEFNIPIGISIGTVLVPEHGTDYHTLFRLADKALYEVKQHGKHGYALYDPSTDVREPGEQDLTQEMMHIIRIVEERSDSGGALYLDRDAFASIYRFVMRYTKRHNMEVIKMLISLHVKPQMEKVDFREAESQFGDVLQKVLRKSDIIWRAKPGQFFLLLPELVEPNVPIVLERVMEKWRQNEYHAAVNVQYVMEQCR